MVIYALLYAINCALSNIFAERETQMPTADGPLAIFLAVCAPERETEKLF